MGETDPAAHAGAIRAIERRRDDAEDLAFAVGLHVWPAVEAVLFAAAQRHWRQTRRGLEPGED